MKGIKSRFMWALFALWQLSATQSFGQANGHARTPAPIVGEQCRYQAAIMSESDGVGDQLKQIRRKKAHPALYLDHPLHDVVRRMRPGLTIDAHSKALLRFDPSMPLVAQYQDSTYFARPGAQLVQMAFEDRVRRSILIPDSLFRVPKDHYVFSAAVTLDFILGRLKPYVDRSSRLSGIYSLEVEGQPKIVVVVSHDYLKAVKPGFPEISIAIFSPGLIFEELIRLRLAPYDIQDPVPMTLGKNGLYWQSRLGKAIDVWLGSAANPACVPVIYVPDL